ncbi:MAG: GPR endopeptidase [Bacilli bacterium]|nr:GPR endopeptidase [Bacilli bacterium]
MHEIKINRNDLDTDLILEQNPKLSIKEVTPYNNIKVVNNKIDKYHYTTISFNDISDKDNYLNLQKVFIRELKKYLKISSDDSFLIIGLGNSKSTPDSLGPYSIEQILVTRYLFSIGKVEQGYSNVCSFSPNVTGNTGIETADLIKSIIKETKVTKVIVIDSLKTNDFERLIKTIQITDKGISPGSGIGNNRQEVSEKTMKVSIIAIGVPTVLSLKDNYIVTPTSIDFIIEKLAHLIGNGINITLHKNFIRHNNY